MTRVLVVNADDFGLTRGVNEGILAAHANGIVTSVSLFANAAATDDAIGIARRTPALGVGCHLTLVDGAPILPPSRVPTLARDGRFRPTWKAFLVDAMLGRIDLGDVERELTAQIERLTASLARLTHFDSHQHVHAYPPVFRVVTRLARRFAISTVRIPHEAPPFATLWRYRRGRAARRQAFENIALTPFAAADRRLLQRTGLPPAPRFAGRALTGALTTLALERLLRSLQPGVTELMTHPGYVDRELDLVRTRLREQRAHEVALFTSRATRELIAREGIVLASHGRGAAAVLEEHSHA